MNHQPDKLFREKFENFQRPVSANAWNRVEARLEKKNNKGLLLKIAASLIFLAVAGVMIWQWNFVNDDSKFLSEGRKKVQEQTTATDNDAEKKSTAPIVVTPQEEKKEEVVAEKKATETKKSSPKKSKTQPAIQDVTVAQIEKETFQMNEVQKVNESVAENPVIENPVIETQAVVVAEVAEQKKEDSGVTLIYSAEEVNEKYLDKKALADATSGEKKPSTFRKLWDKASDLKNNQEAFGDLRQKKNEILALNFIGEKRSKN